MEDREGIPRQLRRRSTSVVVMVRAKEVEVGYHAKELGMDFASFTPTAAAGAHRGLVVILHVLAHPGRVLQILLTSPGTVGGHVLVSYVRVIEELG